MGQRFDGDRERRWLRWLLFAPGVFLLLACGAVLVYELTLNASRQADAAESRNSAEVWAFVPGSIADLSATAVQLCATDAGLLTAATDADRERWTSQQVTLEARYETAAEAYDERVSETIHNGNVRPWEVSPVAPPSSVSKDKSCLKPPTLAAKKAAPVTPGEPYTGTDRFLTLDQLDAAAAAAGWPMTDGWWPQMREIIQCETHSLDRYAHNVDDPNGGSYGLAQLNGTQHFIGSGEDFNQWMDPVVNLRVALWLRTVRGHFGGAGGWMICSERWGIE